MLVLLEVFQSVKTVSALDYLVDYFLLLSLFIIPHDFQVYKYCKSINRLSKAGFSKIFSEHIILLIKKHCGLIWKLCGMVVKFVF